jgi:hypothetical protein
VTAAILKNVYTYTHYIVMALDPSTIDNKVLCGYQGWFLAEGDGMHCGWRHWFHAHTFEPAFDLWPDTSEMGPSELFPSPLKMADGSPGMLLSSCNPGIFFNAAISLHVPSSF